MSMEQSKEETARKEARPESLEENLLDITMYVDAGIKCLRRYWILFVVILSLFSTIGWLVGRAAYTPEYSTYATFVVTTPTSKGVSQSYYNNSTAIQIAGTFPYIISTGAMQYLVAEDLGLNSVPGEVTASALDNTNFVTIRTRAATGDMAYKILQAVIANYQTVAQKVIGNTMLKIIEEGGLPTRAVNANNNKSYAKGGLVFGLILCLAIIVFYVMGRKTIRKEEDLKNLLNVRTLAIVPRVQFKKSRSSKSKLVLLDNPRVSGSFKEACRTMRARVERVAASRGSKVFLVTSASPGEGKSTLAANLAISLSEKGRKVALVDLDLRNPSLVKAFGIQNRRRGTIDILGGRCSMMDVELPYHETSLKLYPGGRPVQLAAKYLGSAPMEGLFSILRNQFDLVVVDTPPSGLLSDAALVANHADEGILVVKQDYAARERVKEGAEMLVDTGLHICGCVFNDVESGLSGYGYGRNSRSKHYKYKS